MRTRARHLALAALLPLAATATVTVIPTTTAVASATGAAIEAFPSPGTGHASPGTTISLRGAQAADLGGLVVTGSASGVHRGTVHEQGDGGGATFVPAEAFAPGETVTVRGIQVDGGGVDGYSFDTAVPARHPGIQLEPGEAPAGARTNAAGPYASRPDLVPPVIDVTTPATGTDGNPLLATPYTGPTSGGPMIFDDTGEPIWYRPVDGVFSGDLEVESYQGDDVLVWFEGVQPYGPGNYRGSWRVLDDTYTQIATVSAGNDLEADIHDVDITDDDTALVVVYNPIRMDLTADGGRSDAIVLEAVVQEVDIATGDVLFEWHSLDEIPVSDMATGDITQAVVDYIHINSVEEDQDGNILMSMRNTSELVKVNRTTGKVMWRLGGKGNDFTFTDGDDGPSLQHDARRLPDGTISIFDNGNGHIPTESRGVRWTVNEVAKTATRFKEQKHSPKIFAPNQGRYQTLADGGQLLSWGGLGTVSEYSSAGDLRFEATIPGGTYRTVRQDWHAIPAEKPAVAVEPGDAVDTFKVSWNGATDVARWAIRAGQRDDVMTEQDLVDRTGFETTLTLPSGFAFVQLVAEKADGTELGRSAPTPIHPWFAESAAPNVSGTYQPLSGDFAGPATDDIVWYAPGSGNEYLWTTGASGGFTSTKLPAVNGTYSPLVADFAGDAHDDILWRSTTSNRSFLWIANGSGGFTSSLRPMPIARQAIVLPVPHAKAEVLGYTPGPGGDFVVHFAAGEFTSVRGIQVSGTYQPSAGDFDGDGYPEVLWYGPGTAKDYLWRFDGEGGQTMGQTSQALTITGYYTVLVGRYSGPGDERDDLLFYAPGIPDSQESLWQGNADGTFAKRTDPSNAFGFALRLHAETDYLYLLTTGLDGFIWEPQTSGHDRYRMAANTAPPAGVVPVIGDFTGSGESSILWYRPGSGAETLFTRAVA